MRITGLSRRSSDNGTSYVVRLDDGSVRLLASCLEVDSLVGALSLAMASGDAESASEAEAGIVRLVTRSASPGRHEEAVSVPDGPEPEPEPVGRDDGEDAPAPFDAASAWRGAGTYRMRDADGIVATFHEDGPGQLTSDASAFDAVSVTRIADE